MNQFNTRTKKVTPLTEKHPDMPDMSEVIKAPGPEVKKSITLTELQIAKMHEGLTHYTRFAANSQNFVIADIECEPDYAKGNTLYIPRTPDEADKKRYGSGKVLFDVLCVNDKQVRKRLEKIVKKWNGCKAVEWHSVTDPDIEDLGPEA